LGAYSKISKDGAKLFDDLVEDGEKAEEQVKSRVDEQSGSAKLGRSAKSRVEGVRGLALGKWNELEEAFDKRLNKAISRLGVPSRLEVTALNEKLDRLTTQVEALTGLSAAAASSQSRPRTAAKPDVKAAASATSEAASAAQSVAKPVVKAAKAVAKPAAKAASKAAPKAAPKTAAKTAAKATPKPAAKAAPKPAEKSTASKPADKPAEKPSEPKSSASSATDSSGNSSTAPTAAT
jgi:poly(hydroxyalkanoate) granule-associated protein